MSVGPGNRTMKFRVVMFAALMLASLAAQAVADISGVPKIIDGNTLIMGPNKIRLARVYAPETDQVCLMQKIFGGTVASKLVINLLRI